MSDSESTPPPLTESARSLYDAARVVAGAWGGSFVALRRLVVADVALARAGLTRWLMMMFLAAILFGTAWALLNVLAVWLLHSAGLGWGIALTLPVLADVLLGMPAVWYGLRALKLADLDASRRQLTLLFGTKEEAQEAQAAAPGTLHAGAPPASAPATSKSPLPDPLHDARPDPQAASNDAPKAGLAAAAKSPESSAHNPVTPASGEDVKR